MIDYHERKVPETFAVLVNEMGLSMLQFASNDSQYHGTISGIRRVFFEQSWSMLHDVGLERLMILMALDPSTFRFRLEPMEDSVTVEEVIYGTALQAVLDAHHVAIIELAFEAAKGRLVRDLHELGFLAGAVAASAPDYVLDKKLVLEIERLAACLSGGGVPEDEAVQDVVYSAGNMFVHAVSLSVVDWEALAARDIDRPKLRSVMNRFVGYGELLSNDRGRALAMFKGDLTAAAAEVLAGASIPA